MEENRIKRANAPKVKSVNGRALILKGHVESITPLKSQYGFSWRIKVNNYNYYFNSSVDGAAEKMFNVGKPCAFTVSEKPNVKNPEQPYLVIAQIFYTF